MASNEQPAGEQRQRSPQSRRRIAVSITLLVLVVGSWCYFRWDTPPELPPVTKSPFLNTAESAVYVGSHVCVECHAEEHDSYLRTNHSRSFAAANAMAGPAAGEYYHSATGRTYRVESDDEQVWHRELLWNHDGEPHTLSEFPVRYQIGSGAHAASFAVDVDGFLMESPMTWYASQSGWAMSPGYDRPQHPGFRRPIPEGCLYCHTGRVEPVGDSYHRFEIREHTIGCERCHGPGSLHVAFRESSSDAAEGADLTIVHPKRLSREREDDLCAPGHRAGEVAVDLRGRRLQDYRPGLALRDYRAYYGLQDSNQSMTVVGHVDQMQASRCYQESDSLTCTSCHALHDRPSIEARLEHYRASCLECHEVHECGISAVDPRRVDIEDNCVTCHMPQSSTEIVHVASTHHRIGIHTDDPPAEVNPAAAQSAVPLSDISHLPLVEQKRCLGLAYLKLTEKSPNQRITQLYADRAREILQQVRDEGVADAEVDAALAQLYLPLDAARAVEYAEAALRRDVASPHARSTALFVAAHVRQSRREFSAAIELLDEVNRIRRHPVHWTMLSECFLERGDIDAALSAMKQAVAVNPADPEIRIQAAELYERAGEEREAEKNRQIARLLRAPGSPPDD